MRFSQKYQPERLSDIVGQPAVVRRLQTFVIEPYPACFLFEGQGGTGKSATAQALIRELGVGHFSVAEYAGADLKIEDVDRLFRHTFRLRPMMGSDWHVLLIEELEFAASKQVNSALKRYLSEQNMPPRLIVVATSNDAGGLDRALLQRFTVLAYSSGPSFADACLERLHAIWEQEMGDAPFPSDTLGLGWDGDRYSMRLALAALHATARRAVGKGVV